MPVTINPIRMTMRTKELRTFHRGVVFMGRLRIARSVPKISSTRCLMRFEYGAMKMTKPYVPMNIKRNEMPRTADTIPSRTIMTISLMILLCTARLDTWIGLELCSSIFHLLINNKNVQGRPTVCVTRGWAGRDNAILPEPAPSHAKCLKTRRLPPVGCTLCWHAFDLETRFSFYHNGQVRISIKTLQPICTYFDIILPIIRTAQFILQPTRCNLANYQNYRTHDMPKLLH
jgi:hypothetical protein